MKVYIVFINYPYEGREVVKVFDDEGDAKEFVKDNTTHRYPYEYEEFEVE